jgi:hypothetical protein
MRRTPAFLVLAASASFLFGCGGASDQGSAPNANPPGTTTYNSSNAPPPSTGGAPAAAPRTNSNANTSPGDTGIKPPTD